MLNDKSLPRRQRRTPAASMGWTHAFTIPPRHPLAAAFAPGVILLLAPCDPSEPLEPGRYLDSAGRLRQCVAGPTGVSFLTGRGVAAGVHEQPVARIVAVQSDEGEPAPVSCVVPFAHAAARAGM